MSPTVPYSFVEKVVDVIGCPPEEPDSVLRESFASCGDIAWVARWSSSGQKHHAFVGFKSPSAATKALMVILPRNRDWRLSKLNPDLKTRVIELLPKFVQVKIKTEEANYTRWIETNPSSTSQAGPSTSSSNSNISSQQGNMSWTNTGDLPMTSDRELTNRSEAIGEWTPAADVPYGGWISDIPTSSWGPDWGPGAYQDPSYLPYDAPPDPFAMPPNHSMMLDNSYRPNQGSSREPPSVNRPIPPRPLTPPIPNGRGRSRSPARWTGGSYGHPNDGRPNTPPLAQRISNLPPKPAAAFNEASNRDGSRRPNDGYYPQPPPPSGPPDWISQSKWRPPSPSLPPPLPPPPPSRGRKDSRASDRGGGDKDALGDSWNNARRDRGDRERERDRDRRPYSRSQERERERDRDFRERDRDRGQLPRSRSPPIGGVGSGRLFRSPQPSEKQTTISLTPRQSIVRKNNSDRINGHDASKSSYRTRALSPGQVSASSKSSDHNGRAPRSRTASPIPPRVGGASLNADLQAAGEANIPALIDALIHHKAPVAGWIEVVSRFRRRNELDVAEKIAQAGINALKKEPSPAPESVKALYLVLANIMSTRIRQLPSDKSDEIVKWQSKASHFIRLAQELGSANAGEATNSTNTDGLAWLERHMLDKFMPPRDPVPTSTVIPAENDARAESLPRSISRLSVENKSVLQGPTTSVSLISGSALQQPELILPPASGSVVDYVRYAELQTQYSFILAQLKSSQAENARLKDKVRSQDDQIRVLQAATAAVSAASSPHLGGKRGRSSTSTREEDATVLLRQAEAERLRLLAVINEERLAKRRAEDAEQEERSVRRKLEDQLWTSGSSTFNQPSLL